MSGVNALREFLLALPRERANPALLSERAFGKFLGKKKNSKILACGNAELVIEFDRGAWLLGVMDGGRRAFNGVHFDVIGGLNPVLSDGTQNTATLEGLAAAWDAACKK